MTYQMGFLGIVLEMFCFNDTEVEGTLILSSHPLWIHQLARHLLLARVEMKEEGQTHMVPLRN